MLVLSRMVGERLIIADQIVITVTQIDRGRVRLGIEAPPEVRVLREELGTRPHQAKPSAGQLMSLGI
jgi:carbon storage regulator